MASAAWTQTTVTLTVDMTNEMVSTDGIHVAGNFQGWEPGGTPMMDNGDGSWSITKSLEAATYEFKFQNGLDGWEELDCGGNRSVEVVLGAPIAYQGCFAQCADVCAIDPDPANVTFQVDASQIGVVCAPGVGDRSRTTTSPLEPNIFCAMVCTSTSAFLSDSI